MEQYLARYNSFTTNGQQSAPPTEAAPQPAPPPPMYGRERSTTAPNYLPQAPANSPMLPQSVINPGAVQQQQQSIGQEFMPTLQGLQQLATKYPEGAEQLEQAGALIMAVMQQIAAKFSQGGLPRSIV